MYRTKIVEGKVSGEYYWESKPYCFNDLEADLPEIARKASETIPNYKTASFDVNSRQVTCYVHQATETGAIILHYKYSDNLWSQYCQS